MFLVLSTTGHLSLFPLLFQAQGKEKRLTRHRTNLRPAKKYERTLCLHGTVCLNRETLNTYVSKFSCG